MIEFIEKSGDLIVIVRVVPRASKSEIVGEHAGALKIRISSAPNDGAANKELIKLLSKTLGVSKSAIEIISGEISKTKQIKICGTNSKNFLQKINN